VHFYLRTPRLGKAPLRDAAVKIASALLEHKAQWDPQEPPDLRGPPELRDLRGPLGDKELQDLRDPVECKELQDPKALAVQAQLIRPLFSMPLA
jgi:hypothetical protein